MEKELCYSVNLVGDNDRYWNFQQSVDFLEKRNCVICQRFTWKKFELRGKLRFSLDVCGAWQDIQMFAKLFWNLETYP